MVRTSSFHVEDTGSIPVGDRYSFPVSLLSYRLRSTRTYMHLHISYRYIHRWVEEIYLYIHICIYLHISTSISIYRYGYRYRSIHRYGYGSPSYLRDLILAWWGAENAHGKLYGNWVRVCTERGAILPDGCALSIRYAFSSTRSW